MTRPEAAFHDHVAAWLSESFVDVAHEPTLPSGRRPDFIAHTPFRSYVIEVENTSETLYNAIGQASVYAAETGYRPVVVFPADDAPGPPLVPEWLTIATV